MNLEASSSAVAPDFDAFAKAYQAGRAQIITRSLVSDLETPVSAYLKLAGRRKNSFLLESVEGGEQLGRFSIIGFKPDIIWRCFGGRSEINRDAAANPTVFAPEAGAPLDNLKRLLAESAIEQPTDDEAQHNLPPMAAGVFGYFGYDMVRQMERLGPRPEGGLDTPDAIFMRPTVVAVFDNIRQTIMLCAPVRPADGVSARAAYSRACERLSDAVGDLSAPLSAPVSAAGGEQPVEMTSNITETEYHKMVARAKDHIAAGDIFQAVLSQRFSCPFDAPSFELYRALRRSNPSPFLFYLNFEDFALVGSSPEILVRVRNGEIAIRPIAGTRPRGQTTAEDNALEADLLADPKERAEHLMLLDLGRNDVGRSAEIGSVRVTESFVIERYSHVMHIVSNVVGKLREDAHPVDAVAAGFPAGTVSGAPKIRAMEIIDDLEKSARGVYGGAIGYFFRRRQCGHLHRVAHSHRQRRRHVCSSWRWNCRRFRPRLRTTRVREQSQSAVCGRESSAGANQQLNDFLSSYSTNRPYLAISSAFPTPKSPMTEVKGRLIIHHAQTDNHIPEDKGIIHDRTTKNHSRRDNRLCRFHRRASFSARSG